MGKALYRKYRPKSLAEVVGQEQVTNNLKRALEQGRISHAYLFIGPRGTGKTSVARIFAHAVNDFPYEIEDDYIDIVEIDGASNRGIEDIRELREKVTIAPSEGKYKVYIIDEVHMLTTPAFNALLKTLEEPPEHVIFIMATTDVQKVPRTILSRVQSFTFQLAKPEVMLEHLKKIAKAEGIKISDKALEIVIERGGGSFRDSLSLLDQIATLSDGEIDRDLVVAAMGLPEEEEIETLLEAYTSGDLVRISEALKQILGAGAKAELLAEGMIRKIVAEPKAEWLGLLSRLPEVVAPFPEAKLLVALTKNVPGEAGASSAVTTTQHFSGRTQGRSAEPTDQEKGSRTPAPEVAASEAGSGPGSNETAKQDSVLAFDWAAYKKRVAKENDAVARQLEKVAPEVRGGVLHLYPQRKIVKNILGKDNNLRILSSVAGGLLVTVHDVDEKPEKQTEKKVDAEIARISAIMGGEVIEDAGGNPF